MTARDTKGRFVKASKDHWADAYEPTPTPWVTLIGFAAAVAFVAGTLMLIFG